MYGKLAGFPVNYPTIAQSSRKFINPPVFADLSYVTKRIFDIDIENTVRHK